MKIKSHSQQRCQIKIKNHQPQNELKTNSFTFFKKIKTIPAVTVTAKQAAD